MIIAETVIAVTVMCTTAAKRQRPEDEPYYVSTVGAPSFFSCSSGMSLERKLTVDLEKIQGVGEVLVTQSGSAYAVNVTMETFDFSSYEKVIQKELELFEKFPDSKFTFNVTFSENSADATSILNAA